jgi:GDP-L-fucose synthase
MASACVFLMSLPEAQFRELTAAEPPLINIGCGEDMEVGELARLVAEVVGFRGKLVFDSSKPDGTPRKLLDVSLLNLLGWKPTIPLRRGIESVYGEFSAKLSLGKTADIA